MAKEKGISDTARTVATRLHPSHRLLHRDGTFICSVCGAWCDARPSLLLKTCKAVASSAGAGCLMRWALGKHPHPRPSHVPAVLCKHNLATELTVEAAGAGDHFGPAESIGEAPETAMWLRLAPPGQEQSEPFAFDLSQESSYS